LVTEVGKLLIAVGALLALFGLLLLFGARLGLPIGRLPGDIVYRGKNTSFYFPIVTCLVLSVVLSFIFWLVGRFTR